MKTTASDVAGSTVSSSTALLARVQLTAADRCRAEAALLRGEALADALLGIARAVKGLFEHRPQHAAERHLKSAS
jgi:hypothetical protein